MSQFFTHFTRTTPDGWAVKLFGVQHLIILGFFFLCTVLLWKKRETLVKKDLLRTPLAMIMLAQITMIYSWYFFTGYSGLSQSLPLYNCRFAIIVTAITLLKDNKFGRMIACYWGLGGGIFASLLPDMDPFYWPHVTQVSFYVSHLSLLLSSLYIFLYYNMKFTKKTYFQIISFATVYHILVAFVNYKLSANYCILSSFPFFDIPLVSNNTVGYTIFAIVCHNIELFIVHFGLTKLQKLRDTASRSTLPTK